MQNEPASTEIERTPIEILSLLKNGHEDSEIVIGLVGAVGTELDRVINMLRTLLSSHEYALREIRVSKDILEQKSPTNDEFERITSFMNAGDELRKKYDNGIVALGVALRINKTRETESKTKLKNLPRTAFVINSLKHPDEVKYLKTIYTHGFFLIGVYSDEKERKSFLHIEKGMGSDQAEEIIKRDASEGLPYGQSTRDTFHLSDFFIHLCNEKDKTYNQLSRIVKLMLGYPYITPTFDEFAMFMAFSSSLRSADLSRQVGAVIARDCEIIGIGANDCPKYGGGLYWPYTDPKTNQVSDIENGRDYTRGADSNKKEKDTIISKICHALKEEEISELIVRQILARNKIEDIKIDKICKSLNKKKISKKTIRQILEKSAIKDITEYGRVVHAEMEAILSCGRTGISTQGATLYCTTFPCHNCAKHIIATGITRVVYVEPYPKSMAATLYADSIHLGHTDKENVIQFEPFIGVGSRRFFDLFAMHLGSGYVLERKDDKGNIITNWKPKLRTQLSPFSYIHLEDLAATSFDSLHIERE